MLYKIALCLLIVLQSALCTQAQKLPVKYVNAQNVVDMAKSSGKPYLWVSIYVPKCANAYGLFSERVKYCQKYSDKVALVMLSILHSNDNVDSVVKFSNLSGFQTPFYVMDTMYIKDNMRETPANFMKDLNQALGAEHQFFEHIVIDKNGKLVYRGEGNDLQKLDGVFQ